MQKITTSLNFLVRFLFIFGTLVLVSGCAGMWADSMARSWVTGETYANMAASHPQIKEGYGRLFLYRVGTSTDSSLEYGIGLVKNPTLCTVDNAVYEIIWEVYRYIDLAEGSHVITCGSDVISKNEHFSSKNNFQRGANQISVVVKNSAEIFVRVDLTGKQPPYFKPTLVDSGQGQTEILNLQYQKIGGLKYVDGKISAP
jgi:hypothetical protein